MRCAGCGRENADHYKFCLGCGQELRPAPPGGRAQAGAAGQIATLLDEADLGRLTPSEAGASHLRHDG
jgi:hypothetical protein